MAPRSPRARTWSLTPLGAALIAVLVAAVIVGVLASGGLAVGAFVVALLAAFVLVGGGLSGRGGRRTGKSLATRRAEFGPRARKWKADAGPMRSQADAWQREREHRAQGQAVPPSSPTVDPPDIGLS